MPQRPCLTCGRLSNQSRCPDHRRKPWHHAERSAHRRGYNNDWRRLSVSIRRRNPTCQVCGQRPSTQADHIISLANGGARLDRRNIQAICDECHAEKTQGER